MEMGQEIRTFHEKGRRGTLGHPFCVAWWAPGSTGCGTSTGVLVGENRAAQETEVGKAGQSGSTAAPSSLLLLEWDNSFLKNIVGVHSLHYCMETNLSLSLYAHIKECFFFSFVFFSSLSSSFFLVMKSQQYNCSRVRVATIVCFRNGSPSSLRLGALATALSVCTAAVKRGCLLFPVITGEISAAFWRVSPWEWGLGREEPSPAVGSSLACCTPLLLRAGSPSPKAAAPVLLLLLTPPALTCAFCSFRHLQEGAGKSCWEEKDIMGLIFPIWGRGV